jgi:hypothetical protein
MLDVVVLPSLPCDHPMYLISTFGAMGYRYSNVKNLIGFISAFLQIGLQRAYHVCGGDLHPAALHYLPATSVLCTMLSIVMDRALDIPVLNRVMS